MHASAEAYHNQDKHNTVHLKSPGMHRALLAAAFALSVGSCTAASCSTPPPASNFELDKAFGVWYEIGRIQTPGGYIGCAACRSVAVATAQISNLNNNDHIISNSARVCGA